MISKFDECWECYWRDYDRRRLVPRKISAAHLWNMAIDQSISTITNSSNLSTEDLINLLDTYKEPIHYERPI